MGSDFESARDTFAELAESAATHVGRIATIVTGAVREITREIGDWATDVVETAEAARRAHSDTAAPLTGSRFDDLDDADDFGDPTDPDDTDLDALDDADLDLRGEDLDTGDTRAALGDSPGSRTR